jgi:anti-sigma factor RsiW
MNDEQRQSIAAYVDGELSPIESQSVRELLDADSEARAYRQKLENLNRQLKGTFDPVARAPLPVAMQQLLAPRGSRWTQWIMPVALAASLGVIAVLLVRMNALDQSLRGQLAQIQSQMSLLRAQTLENVASGKVASWSAPVGNTRIEVEPVRTYRTADKRFCREYVERVEESGAVEVRKGIACRTGKAKWSDIKHEVF